KQFEVTFVFNEKKRKINFETDLVVGDNEFQMDDLKAIRKTTLSGKIRDAISLEAVDATVEIIDNKTNKVISSAISNKLNGNYNISYVAGENYRIEVKAQGYWDHVENLYIEQVISIQNIAKDIMLNKTSEGPKKQTFIIYDEKEEENFTENFKSGQKIPMNNLNFDEKETRLSPNLYPELDRLIDILEKNKAVRIEVAGHADDSGKDRIDNLLALRRAKAVARYLTSHGLDESRIEVKSYSNKRPLVPRNSDKAKQRNRRVEIIVL
ncbi:MAG: OmpA family protein, partial [Bacteroidales bacterium]|nr:OmpA family protein [Bacteroidales bacterium]